MKGTAESIFAFSSILPKHFRLLVHPRRRSFFSAAPQLLSKSTQWSLYPDQTSQDIPPGGPREASRNNPPRNMAHFVRKWPICEGDSWTVYLCWDGQCHQWFNTKDSWLKAQSSLYCWVTVTTSRRSPRKSTSGTEGRTSQPIANGVGGCFHQTDKRGVDKTRLRLLQDRECRQWESEIEHKRRGSDSNWRWKERVDWRDIGLANRLGLDVWPNRISRKEKE